MSILTALVLSVATACAGVEVGYKPPLLPITLVIGTDGEVKVKAGVEFITPIGTFSVDADLIETHIYETLEDDPDSVILVVRTRRGTLLHDHVYQVLSQEIIVTLDGHILLAVSRNRILVDASDGQFHTINVRSPLSEHESTAELANPLPGDLGLVVPMTTVACDGRYAVFVGAAVRPTTYRADVETLLEHFEGASYLLTEQNCRSLRWYMEDGASIYTVYYGPYVSLDEACATKTRVGGGSFIRILNNTTRVGWEPTCSGMSSS
jgi:hypothetical protein